MQVSLLVKLRTRDVTINTAVPEYQPVDPTRTAAIAVKKPATGLVCRRPQTNGIEALLLGQTPCPCVAAHVLTQARPGSYNMPAFKAERHASVVVGQAVAA